VKQQKPPRLSLRRGRCSLLSLFLPLSVPHVTPHPHLSIAPGFVLEAKAQIRHGAPSGTVVPALEDR
jgi:hypothetical protein